MFTMLKLESLLGTFMKYYPKSTTKKYICMDEHKSNKKNKVLVPSKNAQKNARVMDDSQQGIIKLKEGKQPLLLSSSSSQFGIVVHKEENKGIVKKKKNNHSNSVRVKVLMTKEEAIKLLAKRKKEGTLEFRDVVKELAKIPAQRVSVVSLMASSKVIALPSIFEAEEDTI